jgi:hypothetical protein
MPFLIALLSCVLVLAFQYFLSVWLIKIGWFYEYAYAIGGFILFPFAAIAIAMKASTLLKIEAKKQEIPIKLSAVFNLLIGFYLNFVPLNHFFQKYEYETYGIQTKAIIVEKYELQNKTRSYVIVFKPQAPPQQKALKHSVSKGAYTSWKIGDTISIFYSPRYSNMLKIQ